MVSTMTTRIIFAIVCACAVAVLLPCASASANPSVTATSSWSLCSSKNYAVNIENVLISPDPIVAGKLANFTIPAFANEELDGGTVVVTVSFHGFRVHTEKDDLCDKAACPISGQFTLDNSESLPSFTPPGSYKIKFQILDSSSKELGCATINFNIVWGAELEQIVDAAASVNRKLGKRAMDVNTLL